MPVPKPSRRISLVLALCDLTGAASGEEHRTGKIYLAGFSGPVHECRSVAACSLLLDFGFGRDTFPQVNLRCLELTHFIGATVHDLGTEALIKFFCFRHSLDL